MAEITATMVKTLREETGLGMMECKKALQDTQGDMQAAKDLLRTKGLATAEKKAGRTTKEGLVSIQSNAGSATMVEVLCETDFCARNDEFRAMVSQVTLLAAKQPAGEIAADDAIRQAVQSALAKIGENMSFSRGRKIVAPRIGAYLHHNNKVGVIVGVEGDVSDETLSELCMHIAFADPVGITTKDIPAEMVEKEKQIAKQQAIESGKPAEIAEKMVVGKINKYLAANALLEQPFVKDDKKKVKDILGGAKVLAFARFAIGG